MHLDTINSFIDRRPFRAFRLYLLEARHVDVTHPEVIFTDEIAVHVMETTSPDDFQAIDPNCISRIQYIPPYIDVDEDKIPT